MVTMTVTDCWMTGNDGCSWCCVWVHEHSDDTFFSAMSLMKDSMLSVECNSKRQHGTSVLFPLHVHRTTQGTFTFHLDDLILVRLLSVNLNIQVIHVARQETNQFLLSKFRLKGNSACLGEMKHYWISSASLFYLHHLRSCAASAHGAPKWI